MTVLTLWLLESGQVVPAYLDPALLTILEKITHPRVAQLLAQYKSNIEDAADRTAKSTATRTLQLSQGA